MSKIHSIQQVAPKMTLAAKKAENAVMHASKPEMKATASAADAMASQNMAMVNMQKKPYVAPKMQSVELESNQLLATSYDPIPGGPLDARRMENFGFEEEEMFESGSKSSGFWDNEW